MAIKIVLVDILMLKAKEPPKVISSSHKIQLGVFL